MDDFLFAKMLYNIDMEVNKMKYSFQIQKYDDKTESLVVCIEDTPFDDFLNGFLSIDGIPFSKELFTIIRGVVNGISEYDYFSGNAFDVEIKKDFSKISTDYPINQLSECEIKTEELFDIISAYLDERKKYTKWYFRLAESFVSIVMRAKKL